MEPRWIEVEELVQRGYAYRLTQPAGRNFHPDFRPELTPKRMLALGVFGGRYMTDCAAEFPADWFQKAKHYLDRRCPDDGRQVRRWRAFRRRVAQMEKHGRRGDLDCRSRQRQARLHWAYDARRI